MSSRHLTREPDAYAVNEKTRVISARSDQLYQPQIRRPCCGLCPPVYESPFPFQLPNCCAFLWHFVCKCNLCRKPRQPTQAELDQVFPVMHQPVVLQPSNGISLTWLGHACCLFSFADTGHRVLFDPVFSQRCSPVQFAGPLRYRQPPCGLEQLLPLDAVCISHNHYDHLDSATIQQLARLLPNAVFCVPKGDGRLILNLGCRNIRELDWWETVQLPSKTTTGSSSSSDSNSDGSLAITFTPSKHWSSRSISDTNRSLWGSYVIRPKGGNCCFFGGDTGYEERLFKQIRQQFGPMRLSAIPIGAYLPRHLLSPQHVSPKEAVWIHKDLDSAKSVGIHWGTFDMGTTEAAMDPPKDLAAEKLDQNVPDEQFVTVLIGQSVQVE